LHLSLQKFERLAGGKTRFIGRPVYFFLTNMKYGISKPSRSFITLQVPNKTTQNHIPKCTVIYS